MKEKTNTYTNTAEPAVLKEKKKPDKKKTTIIILSIVVAILVVIGVILALMFIAQKGESIELFQNEVENSWNTQTEEQEKPAFMKLLESKSNFKVDSFKDDGDGHFTLSVIVTSPDILPAVKELKNNLKQELSQEELDALFTKVIDEANPKESSVSLSVVKVDDVYQVEFNDEFIDAMYGYAYSFASSQLSEATNIK